MGRKVNLMKLYTGELDMVIESKIKPNMKRIFDMKTQGLKDKHIAKALGISVYMFQQAVDGYEELKDVYEDATEILCSKLREVVIERALGTDGKLGKNGKPVGPDANLALRTLEKIDPEYSKKESNVNVNMTVEHVIHEINEKRRMEREKREKLQKKNEERLKEA